MMAKFLGYSLDTLTREESLEKCVALCRQKKQQHVVLNAAKVIKANKDPQLRKIINSAAMVNADGMSVVWGARLLGIEVPERVTGIDLMGDLVAKSAELGLSIYLLGATQPVVEKVAEIFTLRGANIVGYRNGFWDSEQESEVVEDINRLSPDILFVAVPSPQKEYFLYRNRDRLEVGLGFGVGGSFDVVAGKTKRAPLIMQKLGLEWFYRFIQEPHRLFKRYAVTNISFVLLVMGAKLFGYKANANK